MNRRAKNYDLRSASSELPLQRSASGSKSFFKNSLIILIILALFQLGAALLALAPRFSTVALQLASHKHSAASETLLTVPVQKKLTPLSQRSENNSVIFKTESSSTEGNNVQPGASLSIIDVRQTHGSLGEQTLKIAIKSQTQETISIPDIKVQVYFYDQQGGEIVPSKAPVTSRWLRSPVEWKDGEPEILEVIYQPENNSAELSYAGYIIAVYYKGELQSYRADPVKLTSHFPIKVFIGPNEL